MESEAVIVNLLRRALGYKPVESLEAVDWVQVKELSLRHRVAPLLGAVSSEDIPNEMCSWAHSVAIACAQCTIQTKRILGHVKESFDAAGVRALLFKGVALQEWAYGGLVRASADIDLLVEAHMAPAAALKLRGLGFHKKKSSGAHVHPHNPVGLWQDRYGNSIDLHTLPIEPYVYPFAGFSELWEERVEIASLAFSAFSPAHHMLLLLLHGSKHQWCRLSWIVDVAAASKKLQDSDWLIVCELSKKLGASRAVAIGSLLCDEILGTPQGWHALSSLPQRSPVVRRLVAAYRQRLFLPMPNTAQVKLSNILLHLRTFEGLEHKARYVLERLGHAMRRKESSIL